MSNFHEGSGAHGEGAPIGGPPYQEPVQGTSPAYQGQAQGGTSQFETPQYAPSAGATSNWQTQPGSQGQGQQGQGMFSGGNPHYSRGRRSLHVRSTFKTTEFWVMVVVGAALLIAAAVTDQGSDNQGFGAQEAWKYVTWLAIAYIVSRGLTKFGENDEDYDDNNRETH